MIEINVGVRSRDTQKTVVMTFPLDVNEVEMTLAQARGLANLLVLATHQATDGAKAGGQA